jgi:hypothetical protein
MFGGVRARDDAEKDGNAEKRQHSTLLHPRRAQRSSTLRRWLTLNLLLGDSYTSRSSKHATGDYLHTRSGTMEHTAERSDIIECLQTSCRI